jgi:hypothetical protein
MSDPFTYLADLSSRFPIQLKILFSFRKLRDLRKFLDSNTLTREELARAAYSAHLEGFTHELRNIEYLPKDLEENRDEVNRRLRENHPIENLGLISRIFEQRKIVITHMFHRNSRDWHVIYFTIGDIQSDRENHWQYGPHVHFVNHLWRGYDPIVIWKSLGERRYGSIGEHYRFDEHRRANK